MFAALISVLLPVVFAKNLHLQSFYRDVATANQVCVNKPADVVFILDESSSIYYKDFYSQVDFVMGLAPRFNIDAGDIRVGAMTFSNTTNIRFELGEVATLSELEVEMEKIKASQKNGDMTKTFDAIELMVSDMFSSEHARSGVAHITILITDGQSSDFGQTSAQAQRARDAGITMFAIGVGKNLKKELKAIASDPDEEFVFEVENYDILEDISNKLVERTCTTITTTPPPSVEGCDKRELMDIIFSLPDHAGIEGTSYAIEFVNSVVTRVNLGPVKVGVTPRLCYPGDDIPLYEHDSQMDFIMALNQRQLTTADTDIHIDYIIEEGMAHGNNEEQSRFAVLIVDSRFSDREATLEASTAAKNAGIHLIVIGVGGFIDKTELEVIAHDRKSLFIVNDYSQLQGVTGDVITRFCEGMIGDNGIYDYSS